jgi:ADP-ribose pyrophosphatase YjhB (NUDIX family)
MKRPKHMLIELPTADEIDQLAITTPKFEVRHLSFDMGDEKADLHYSPCKGQVVLVARGPGGTVLTKARSRDSWELPSDRIDPNEDIGKSPKRVARETCGIMLRSVELAGIYDVIWHYSNVSIKRLHVVYACLTDDTVCSPEKKRDIEEARFFSDVPEETASNPIFGPALADCSAK